MRVGDLIKFETKSWVMEVNRSNPGLIIEDVSTAAPMASTERYRIMWADQQITVEHACYLAAMEAK
jgi:hypothetical protein